VNVSSKKTVGSSHNVPRKKSVQPTSDGVKMDFSDSTDELKLVRSPFTLAPLTKVAWDIKGPISPATLGRWRQVSSDGYLRCQQQALCLSPEDKR
jgi:hypothetical protein